MEKATIDIPCPVLRELCEVGMPTGAVNPRYAEALYRFVLDRRPETVIEVGFAGGVTAMAVLRALAELGGERRLISMDPRSRPPRPGRKASGTWSERGLATCTALLKTSITTLCPDCSPRACAATSGTSMVGIHLITRFWTSSTLIR